MTNPLLNIINEFKAYSDDLRATRTRVVAFPESEYKAHLLQAIDAWGGSYYDLKKSNQYGNLDVISSLGQRYQNIKALVFHLETGGDTQGVLPTGQ